MKTRYDRTPRHQALFDWFLTQVQSGQFDTTQCSIERAAAIMEEMFYGTH